jgi:hypothetical protein
MRFYQVLTKALLALVVATCMAAATASAASIAIWPAAPNGATLPATTENPDFGTSADDIARGPGIVQAAGATFNSSGFTVPSPADFDAAVTAGDYLSFGFTTSVPIDLTDMDIRYDRSGTGPSNLQIQLSINGGAFAPVFTDNAVSDLGEDQLGIPLGAFLNVTEADFRISLFGATSTGGTFDIETINFAGGGTVGIEVRGVPEPATVVLSSFGLIGLSLSLLRRRIFRL